MIRPCSRRDTSDVVQGHEAKYGRLVNEVKRVLCVLLDEPKPTLSCNFAPRASPSALPLKSRIAVLHGRSPEQRGSGSGTKLSNERCGTSDRLRIVLRLGPMTLGRAMVCRCYHLGGKISGSRYAIAHGSARPSGRRTFPTGVTRVDWRWLNVRPSMRGAKRVDLPMMAAHT